jgi:hypothetical protein
MCKELACSIENIETLKSELRRTTSRRRTQMCRKQTVEKHRHLLSKISIKNRSNFKTGPQCTINKNVNTARATAKSKRRGNK